MSAICRAIPTRMAACTCRPTSPTTSTPSPKIGTPVILAGGHSDPASVADPGAILGTTAKEEIEAKIGGKPIPSLSPEAVMSILVSRADMKIYVLQNADIVAEGAATIKDPTEPIGSNVFVWQGGDAKGSTWEGMGFHADPSVPTAPNTDVLQRIDGAPDVMDVIRDRIKPGTVLVTTDSAGIARDAQRQQLHGDGRADVVEARRLRRAGPR